MLQELLEAEMDTHIGAAPYERSDSRKGHRNGNKPRTVCTRFGTLNLLVPLDRVVVHLRADETVLRLH